MSLTQKCVLVTHHSRLTRRNPLPNSVAPAMLFPELRPENLDMKLRLKSGQHGYTLVELLVVVAVLAVLAAFLLPALRTRHTGQQINCINNLKQVCISFRQWAIDNNEKFPMQVSVTNGGTMELVESGIVFPHFQVMSNELGTPKTLICPEDASRTNAFSFIQKLKDSQISYFVGVDADQTKPAMFLVGDNNLGLGGVPAKHGLLRLWTNSPVEWIKPRPRHNNGGNVGLADGSVQQAGDAQLRQLLRQTGVATNRLAIP